jgi:hypothetical protein
MRTCSKKLDAVSVQLPQNLAALHNGDPEQGRDHRGVHWHIRAANESVSMQALFPSDLHTPTVVCPLPASTVPNRRGSNDLQWLGERLRAAYGPIEAPLPARMTELVERLARHENSRDKVRI